MTRRKLEVQGEAIGYTHHEGRDGWVFTPIWEPGMGEEKLKSAIKTIRREGMDERSQEIGRILGINKS
jgi:hypothetical protein